MKHQTWRAKPGAVSSTRHSMSDQGSIRDCSAAWCWSVPSHWWGHVMQLGLQAGRENEYPRALDLLSTKMAPMPFKWHPARAAPAYKARISIVSSDQSHHALGEQEAHEPRLIQNSSGSRPACSPGFDLLGQLSTADFKGLCSSLGCCLIWLQRAAPPRTAALMEDSSDWPHQWNMSHFWKHGPASSGLY